MDELFATVASDSWWIQTSGLGFSGPITGGAAWLRGTVLSPRALLAHLGLGRWQHSSPRSSCSPLADPVTLGTLQIPLRPCWHVMPRPFCAGHWTMYRVCLVLTWLERTKTTRTQYSKLRRASLLSTGHIWSFPSESVSGISLQLAPGWCSW